MKKSKNLLVIISVLLLGGFLFSCNNEMIQDELTSSSLKKATISDLTPIEQLGKFIYFDKISSPNSMACAECHAPSVGFTGATVGINIHGSVYRGADAQNFGDRKPPSAAYATFSPILHINSDGIFEGGNFWDGRATGERLGSAAAEQALGPFLNPAEHNLTHPKEVLMKIAKAKYSAMWETVWGEPLAFSTPDEIFKNYDRVGFSIAAYEGSREVNQFSSKYDAFLASTAVLTEQEAWGLELFNGKGMCSACHPSVSDDNGVPPLFTDFTFDNLGVPKNPANPVYKNNPGFIDLGLGGYLASRDDYKDLAPENMGKHKVPTLRNVAKKPGNGFTKAYLHNGVFKSLKDVVHFYNTRDVKDWPAPEVAENVNSDELGNLGLTDAEEDAIVAFMMTLSDGYMKK